MLNGAGLVILKCEQDWALEGLSMPVVSTVCSTSMTFAANSYCLLAQLLRDCMMGLLLGV